MFLLIEHHKSFLNDEIFFDIELPLLEDLDVSFLKLYMPLMPPIHGNMQLIFL